MNRSTSERAKVLREALRDQRKATREAGERVLKKRNARLAVTRPWVVLKENWERFLTARYGMEVESTPWGAKDRALARKMVKEFGLETAIEMADKFIALWSGSGLPVFAWFWNERDSYKAVARGQIELGNKGLTRGEYDENVDGKGPAHGW